jgi:hypothetical protein
VRLALLTTAALLLTGAATAQTVWRCGPDGRSYPETPCAEGRVFAVADPRSTADVAQARAVAVRELALARELVQQRRDREDEALGRSRTPVAKRSVAMPATPGIRPSAAAEPAKTQNAEKAEKTEKAEKATRKATASAPPTRPPASGGTSPSAAPGFPRTTG